MHYLWEGRLGRHKNQCLDDLHRSPVWRAASHLASLCLREQDKTFSIFLACAVFSCPRDFGIVTGSSNQCWNPFIDWEASVRSLHFVICRNCEKPWTVSKCCSLPFSVLLLKTSFFKAKIRQLLDLKQAFKCTCYLREVDPIGKLHLAFNWDTVGNLGFCLSVLYQHIASSHLGNVYTELRGERRRLIACISSEMKWKCFFKLHRH